MSFVTTRTPLRISFFGGGTDYPEWYEKETGAVLSTTIDKYAYISCRFLPPFFENRYRIVWTHIENVSSISEILHPAVREGLRMRNFSDTEGDGVELHYQGDLPARAGMGSSSSFAVGLLSALHAMAGEKVDHHTLAKEAIELERDRLKESVGVQDQVAAAHGGVNYIHMAQDGNISVSPIQASRERLSSLNDNLMLFYLGTSRLASEVAKKVIENIPNRRPQLLKIRDYAEQARVILEGNANLDDFGSLLNETWQMKRQIADTVSTKKVDEVYSMARSIGALGGKLLGAGNTGFMLLYVPPERQADVKRGLKNLLHVPFRFEYSGNTFVQE